MEPVEKYRIMNIANMVGVLALLVGMWLYFLTGCWGFQEARKVLKWGISQDPIKRYSSAGMEGRILTPIA